MQPDCGCGVCLTTIRIRKALFTAAAELTMQSVEMQSFRQVPDDVGGKLVTCGIDKLQPHPSYVRCRVTVAASQLSALADLGDLAFQDPIVITQDYIIIDGYARLELARRQNRLTLRCIERNLTEQEALQYLLQKHLRSNGWNAFTRISLALDLENGFKEQAQSNQRAGGQNKGLSILTEAERLDVRKEIARIAGVSAGNVAKVKQLTATAHSDIIKALREKELSIHRAWLWSKLSPEEQREKLWLYQSKRGIGRTIRHLLSPYVSKRAPFVTSLGDLIKVLAALQSGKLGSVRLASINVPGKAVFVTEELFRALEAQEESALTCATNNP